MLRKRDLAIVGLTVVFGLVVSPAIHAESANRLSDRQLRLLGSKCLQCHAAPHTGAPQIGQEGDWRAVLAQGEALTLKHVVEGVGGMPPLGYCSACDETDLRQLVRFVAGFESPVEEGPSW